MKIVATIVSCIMIVLSATALLQAKEIRSCEYNRNENRNWFYWCDFSSADLQGKDLSSTNFKESIFKNARLNNAKLNESDLTGSDVSGADFTGADLSNAILINVNLNGAKLNGANLSGAIITGYEVCDSGSIGKCMLKKQQGPVEEILLQLALDYPEFRTLTKNINSNDPRPPLVVLKNNVIPQNAKLTHVGVPVRLFAEQELIRENIKGFLEFSNLVIIKDRATVNYGYPEGAHLGTIYFKKIDGRWVIEKRDAMRSSSYGRDRLREFKQINH